MPRKWLVLPGLIIAQLHLAVIHCGAQGAPPGELPLSREQAIEMAIGRNIEVDNESLSTMVAEMEARRSRGYYNPVLNITANSGITAAPGEMFRTRNTLTQIGIGQNLPTGGTVSLTSQTGYTTAESDNPSVSSNDWQSSLGINASQPLLRNAWGEATNFPIYLADTGLQDALERFRSLINDTIYSVTASYNRLYTMRQVLQSRKAALDAAEKLLDDLTRKVTPENPLSVERSDADFAVIERRRDLVEMERNVRDHEAGFRYLIGMESKDQIIPVDPPSREEPMETEEEAVAAALEFRPDLQQLRTSLKVAEVQERIARRQALPDLSLTATGGLNGVGGSIGTDWQTLVEGRRRYWTVGMQFSYPLGNTAAVNDYQRAKVRTEQIKNQVKSLSWRVRNDVESDMRALISARLQVRMADRSLKVAEQRQEEYRKQIAAGKGKVQDLINAENDLTSARNSQADAVEVFANAVSRLRRDTGTLSNHHGIRIDTKHPGRLTRQAAADSALELVER